MTVGDVSRRPVVWSRAGSAPTAPLRQARRLSGDRVFRGALRACALAFIALVGALVAALALGAWPAIRGLGASFLVGMAWDPVAEQFGVVPFVYGTLVSSVLALVIAVPLGLGAAICLAEWAPGWVAEPVGFLIELLAAIPSVVYGLWGIVVLVPVLRTWVQPALGSALGFLPLFEGPPYGVGMLAAGLILGIMVVPFIATLGRDVLRAVPTSQREAALALGATRWETTRLAVLPYGRSGLLGAGLLALGRALGETMAVTMVIGNRPEVAVSLFAPGYTMASVIANEFTEATSDLYVAALIEVALLLLAITVAVNAAARLLLGRVGRPAPAAGE